MKRNQKWKIPRTVLEKRIFCFSSHTNRKLKVNMWWFGARERKKTASFIPFMLSKGNYFKIYVLSQCIVYWIHFHIIHTFTHQKNITSYTFVALFLKSSKAFSVSLSLSLFAIKVINYNNFDHASLIFAEPWKLANEIMLNIMQNFKFDFLESEFCAKIARMQTRRACSLTALFVKVKTYFYRCNFANK